jgi:c(7)-type cytochrome triheme protein
MKEAAAKTKLQLRLVTMSVLGLIFVFSVGSDSKIKGVLNRLLNAQSNPTLAAVIKAQDPQLDYSRFFHISQRHASLACTSCHERTADNSVTPRFPGHKACTGCHLAQFVTPAIPICQICHTNVQSSNPPLKGFPTRFNEKFNVKFDHAQHVRGTARPRNGCNGCHDRPLLRGAALSIPVGLNAHVGCYSCHTPDSKSNAGREIASCGVCHDQRAYVRTSTNSRAFRFAFSHLRHGPRQRLACDDCHSLTAGAAQSRQVSSPATAQHFPLGRTNCVTCHNGKRAFGGDLSFKDCRRCHIGQTFRSGE